MILSDDKPADVKTNTNPEKANDAGASSAAAGDQTTKKDQEGGMMGAGTAPSVLHLSSSSLDPVEGRVLSQEDLEIGSVSKQKEQKRAPRNRLRTRKNKKSQRKKQHGDTNHAEQPTADAGETNAPLPAPPPPQTSTEDQNGDTCQVFPCSFFVFP